MSDQAMLAAKPGQALASLRGDPQPGLQTRLERIDARLAPVLATVYQLPTPKPGEPLSLEDKLRLLRAEHSRSAVATMVRATVAYDEAAVGYNQRARELDPALHDAVRKLAHKTNLFEEEVVSRVLDTREADPQFAALRPRMASLAASPEMAERSREMEEIARIFEDRANEVAVLIRQVDGGRSHGTADQIASAATVLQETIAVDVAGPVGRMTKAVAGTPRPDASSPMARMLGAMDSLGAQAQGLSSTLGAALHAAVRR